MPYLDTQINNDMTGDKYSDLFGAEERQQATPDDAKATGPAADPHSPKGQSQEPSTAMIDQKFEELKARFKLTDETFENLEEKKQAYKEEFKKRYAELDEKAEAFNKKADEAANQAWDFLFKTGKSAAQAAKNLFEKGRDKAYELEEELRKRDEAAEAEAKARKERNQRTAGDSLLSGMDSFFEKAKRFADDEPVRVRKDANAPEPKKSNDKIYGFEDLDGDGNPLIDDAIIDEEP